MIQDLYLQELYLQEIYLQEIFQGLNPIRLVVQELYLEEFYQRLDPTQLYLKEFSQGVQDFYHSNLLGEEALSDTHQGCLLVLPF